MLSLAFLLIKAANIFIMPHSNQVSNYLPNLQDQKLLTLCWHSFSEWGRERVTSSLAYNASQYLIYECLQPIATHITQDARPKIVHALVTLIFRMGKGACLSLLWL